MLDRHSMKDVLAVVLAGGAGERLYPLTRNEAKPAVHFGGMYRIIDFTLSNCINSQIRKILVLVQYKSLSLIRHIHSAWNLSYPEWSEFIEVIPAQKRTGDNWYLGTADAIYQNLYSIDPIDCREVMILSGDHIYKMDYQKMVAFHRAKGAAVTLAALEVPLGDANRFGVLEVNSDNQVIGFYEKPEKPRPSPRNPNTTLASMGVYVFDKATLNRACFDDAERMSSHDLGKDIIPRLIETDLVYAYPFVDENRKEAKYWRDVGTLDSFWEANMDFVAVDPLFNLYDQEWPVRTKPPMAPPAKFVFADEGIRFGVAIDSIVSPGCIISGGMVRRSVLSPEVRVNSYSYVEESILMPEVSIGRRARVRKAIIDSGVHVPEDTVIGYDTEEDARRFRV
ncbi:MAG: glucose-1-phosphate adenylyltransferase, partial [Candidatus Hydrogenedentes bacterium]|nr:glucose-1-phosphate adenylyltransferase [Candidatus Hydrogenedentota bacterium]